MSETNEKAREMPCDEWMARASAFELLSMGLLTPTRELAEVLSSGDFAEAGAEAAEVCGFDANEELFGSNATQAAIPRNCSTSCAASIPGCSRRRPSPLSSPT